MLALAFFTVIEFRIRTVVVIKLKGVGPKRLCDNIL